jgi:hypothetical protein
MDVHAAGSGLCQVGQKWEGLLFRVPLLILTIVFLSGRLFGDWRLYHPASHVKLTDGARRNGLFGMAEKKCLSRVQGSGDDHDCVIVRSEKLIKIGGDPRTVQLKSCETIALALVTMKRLTYMCRVQHTAQAVESTCAELVLLVGMDISGSFSMLVQND